MADPNPQNNEGFSAGLGVSNPRRDEICAFPDYFNDPESFSIVKPSSLLKGEWHVMLRENRILNPD